MLIRGLGLLLLCACQQPFGLPPGRASLCPPGYHFVVDSLSFHNVCVPNTMPRPT